MCNIKNLLEIENKIKIVSDYTSSNNHHDMCCMICAHEWRATPKSKRQTYKKWGVGGCPECNKNSKELKIVNKLIKRLKQRNMEYIGTVNFIKSGNEKKRLVKVKNLSCGHIFDTRSDNLLKHNINCPICNTKNKRNNFITWQEERSEEYKKTANEWDLYRHEVYAKTRQTYNQFKHIINPDNLPRGLAGTEGAYQLDHIKSIRFCFDNNISISECSSLDNLQMLTWEENLSNGKKVKK